MIQSVLNRHIENALLLEAAERGIPPQEIQKIENRIDSEFLKLLPRYCKQFDVQNEQELEKLLLAIGSSLDQLKKEFHDQTITGEWLHRTIDIDVDKEISAQEQSKEIQPQRRLKKIGDYVASLKEKTLLWSIFDKENSVELAVLEAKWNKVDDKRLEDEKKTSGGGKTNRRKRRPDRTAPEHLENVRFVQFAEHGVDRPGDERTSRYRPGGRPRPDR